MRVIDDDLIARIVILCVVVISFALYLVKFLGPGKPVLNLIICSGMYYPSYDLMGKRFSPELPIIALAFLVNVSLMIPIYLKRRQNEEVDQQYEQSNDQKIPNSLESLIWNLVIISVCLIGILVIEKNNQTSIDELDDFPNNLFPFYIQFMAQIQPAVFLSIHILLKYRRFMWKALVMDKINGSGMEQNGKIFSLTRKFS